MAKPKSIYRRLTGRYRTLLGYSQLWIAPDHLLLLKSSRVAEEYRRFAFSDIQAVVITELPDSQVAQVVAILGSLLWTALALTVSSPFGQGFFLLTGFWLMALSVVSLARGQRCRCHLYTAVSRELLTPVRRMRTARTLLTRIRPEIEAVQGTLPADGIMESAASAAVAERPPAEIPPAVPAPPLGYAMEILFGLILADAVLIPVAQRFPNVGSEAFGVLMTTFLAEIALAIYVLVRRASHDPRRAAFVLTGVALACMAADLFGIGRSTVAWFGQLMEAAQRQQTTPPQFALNLSGFWIYFAVLWRVFLGLTGLLTSRMERSPKMEPSPKMERSGK
jgi:hypothetical protein